MRPVNKILLLFLFIAGIISPVSSDIIEHEIRYQNKSATEVYLVYGINNWQLPNKELLPAGSFVKDQLVYVQMQRGKAEYFAAKVRAAPGSLIDYVFWITKGPLGEGTDVWDLNAPLKDYHSLASGSVVTFVESQIKALPATPFSINRYILPLLLTIAAALFLTMLFRRVVKKKRLRPPGVFNIAIASGISLFSFLMMIRPAVAGNSWELILNTSAHLRSLPVIAYHDFIYVLVITLIFAALLALFRNHKKTRLAVLAAFVVLCTISLIAGILNVKVVQILGKPFNYQWFYYSDFLQSPDAQAAVSANFSSSETRDLLFLCLAAALFAILLSLFLQQLTQTRRTGISRAIVMIIFVVFAGYIVGAKPGNLQIDEDRLANPVTAFLSSVNPFQENPALFTMEVPDSLVYKKPRTKKSDTAAFPAIKNVVVFVMESASAEYVEPYNKKYSVTPNLTKNLENSLVFENVYAHAPATNISMVSLLNSVYPWLSYNSLTQEHPDLPSPSITEVLKTKGYRTAFFNSADNRYQKAGEFLKHRQFETISDCNTNSCGGSFVVEENSWDFMNGKDDGCTATEMCDWLNRNKNKPFFSVMWTYQTHYPYFFEGDMKSYTNDDPNLNRYLNALHYSDSLLGTVIENLRQNQLFDSTLIVVVGDHGEAFGRHDQICHGRKIYEENLHVPCILINPAFTFKRISEVGGLVDVAPTIMDLMGGFSPSPWEGTSLLSKGKDSRCFFFAPWSDFLFGYREGDYKYIFNASKNETEIYNIREDPFESNNLISEKQHEKMVHHQKLAAWAQHVNLQTKKLLNRK